MWQPVARGMWKRTNHMAASSVPVALAIALLGPIIGAGLGGTWVGEPTPGQPKVAWSGEETARTTRKHSRRARAPRDGLQQSGNRPQPRCATSPLTRAANSPCNKRWTASPPTATSPECSIGAKSGGRQRNSAEVRKHESPGLSRVARPTSADDDHGRASHVFEATGSASRGRTSHTLRCGQAGLQPFQRSVGRRTDLINCSRRDSTVLPSE